MIFFLPSVFFVTISIIMPGSDVGGNQRRDSDGMVIYVGDGGGGKFNTPYFDQEMVTNYTVQVGQSVTLSCIVRQIGSKSVSWVRKSDSAILSVDDMLVIFDNRINIEKTSYLAHWGLNIKSVKPSDSGHYECQVSTEHKLSKIVNLNVVVPTLAIEGSPSILASAGSNITLKCSVKGESSLTKISWFYENVDSSRKMIKEVKGKIVQTGPGTLLLVRVDANSGGNYSCSTHTSNTAVVTINIVDGERVPEAMVEEKLNIHNSSTSSGYSPVICVINMVALSVTYLVTLNLHPSNKPAT